MMSCKLCGKNKPWHCMTKNKRMIKNIALISNICFEPYWRSYIKERFTSLFSDISIVLISTDEIQLSKEEIEEADIVCICINFEAQYPNFKSDVITGNITYSDIENDCLQKCRELYLFIKANCRAEIIWFGFEDYYCVGSENYGSLLFFNGLIDRLNLQLSDMLQGTSFVDIKRLIATVGIQNAFDIKGKHRWNSPYSKSMVRLMVDEVHKRYLINIGETKKCLVLDCDNVLWGGILSEDGIEGIQLANSGIGRQYQDFQRYLLDLYHHGVILTVCSKNDESDVLCVFRQHTGMLLKEEYISCFRCNWNDKTENIKAIVETLNISLDSVVFVDDSAFEIGLTINKLPAVTSVLYRRETIYSQLACFKLKPNVDLQTIVERTNTYRTNVIRNEVKKSTDSYEEYLASLEVNVDIHPIKECELARASELTQRTNKCTNGVRYTLEQLKLKKWMPGYEIYTVCLSDKYCDFGLVGVLGVIHQTVDLFSLSCRALGHNVEHEMLKFILRKGCIEIRNAMKGNSNMLCELIKPHGVALIENVKE